MPTATPTTKTIADLAREMQLKKAAEKENGGTVAKKIVISNENLADYADKGNVTTAKPVIAAPPTSSTEGAGSGLQGEEKRDYWRRKYSEQVAVIADLEAEIARLDSEIPKLWQDFYARDDPAYRDGVIKPKLDESLVRRQNLEEQLETEREKPQQILAEARKDGAQPGWFRDLQ